MIQSKYVCPASKQEYNVVDNGFDKREKDFDLFSNKVNLVVTLFPVLVIALYFLIPVKG